MPNESNTDTWRDVPRVLSPLDSPDLRAVVLRRLEMIAAEPWCVLAGGDRGRDPNAFDVYRDPTGHHPIARGYWGGKYDMHAIVLATATFAAAREALRAVDELVSMIVGERPWPDAPINADVFAFRMERTHAVRAAVCAAIDAMEGPGHAV